MKKNAKIPPTFTESKENKDNLTRLVIARWAGIAKVCRELGMSPGRKPIDPDKRNMKKNAKRLDWLCRAVLYRIPGAICGT